MNNTWYTGERKKPVFKGFLNSNTSAFVLEQESAIVFKWCFTRIVCLCVSEQRSRQNGAEKHEWKITSEATSCLIFAWLYTMRVDIECVFLLIWGLLVQGNYIPLLYKYYFYPLLLYMTQSYNISSGNFYIGYLCTVRYIVICTYIPDVLAWV